MEKQKPNAIEKTIFVLGLLILALLIGYLSYAWGTKENKPPSLEITSSYEPSFQRYTFKIETTNKGEETAKSVNIGFGLYQEGKIVENAVLEIDFVPVKSKEQGWISFSNKRKPSDSLVVKSITFLKP